MDALYHLISVLEGEQTLPEECWLFSRIYEWAPSRGGVWQYYEGLASSKFARIDRDLAHFGLTEVAEKFRSGRNASKDQQASLDQWLETNTERIYSTIFDLVAGRRSDFQ